MKYKRILLKLSGESLQGGQKYGLSPETLQSYAEQIKAAAATGVQIGIVIGGGNIFRGLTGAKKGFDRVKGDQMGMLATIINSLALQSALEDNGVRCKVLTSIRMEPIGEYYSKARAIEYLEAGYVVIIGGGKAAYYLAKQLLHMGISVKIIEIDKARCEELSILLPKAVIINGDGTNEDLLKEEGIEYTESFVALTGIDEENILLTLYARQVSNAKVITKINRITFKDVISNLDLGSVIYPRYITSETIIAYVRAKKNSMGSDIETLYHMFDHRAEAIEFRVREKSAVTNISLAELPLKKNLLLSCINRNGKIIIPSGQDCIRVGDTVMIVTTHTGFNDILDILETSR